MKKVLSQEHTKGVLTRCVVQDEQQMVVAEKPSQQQLLVMGQLMNYQIAEGIRLHGGSSKELTDFQVISTAPQSLVMTFLLKGKLEFGYDQLKFQLDAQTQPTAVLVNLAQPCSFTRKIIKDNEVVKLNLIIHPEWLKRHIGQDPFYNAFTDHHHANLTLHICQQMQRLVIDIICYKPEHGVVGKLKVEALTHQLLVLVFEQIEQQLKEEQRASVMVNKVQAVKQKSAEQAMEELVAYIETHLDAVLTTKILAQHMKMSESSLQRKFKSMFSYSIQNYIKRRKLEVAKQHLQAGVASITEVAYNAGYRHPSNFTHAFKKAFGYPPAQLHEINH